MGMDELASIPPIPQSDREPDSPVSAPSVRKNPIRDSIKAARGVPRQYPKTRLPFSNGKVIGSLHDCGVGGDVGESLPIETLMLLCHPISVV